MYPRERNEGGATDAPTDLERHHAALAYARARGNRDIDVDPQTPTTFSVPRMVVE